mmetsp:Transcript_29480/g.68381  ORF Transcript_29480/g.68381 Transcript_29480/m.68381 type:complete len:288 (-) Transcript_29480:104-967(-)
MAGRRARARARSRRSASGACRQRRQTGEKEWARRRTRIGRKRGSDALSPVQAQRLARVVPGLRGLLDEAAAHDARADQDLEDVVAVVHAADHQAKHHEADEDDQDQEDDDRHQVHVVLVLLFGPNPAVQDPAVLSGELGVQDAGRLLPERETPVHGLLAAMPDLLHRLVVALGLLIFSPLELAVPLAHLEHLAVVRQAHAAPGRLVHVLALHVQVDVVLALEDLPADAAGPVRAGAPLPRLLPLVLAPQIQRRIEGAARRPGVHAGLLCGPQDIFLQQPAHAPGHGA